ncbi:hypothetical protein P5W99_36575 [Paraburkholderia sp. A3BS-1L]|uniref:hypothetical protein n=1 Tax=Paraburkholderia sp. A3BS-1L TaxID=3028375 RepID=UPI003DA8BCBD
MIEFVSYDAQILLRRLQVYPVPLHCFSYLSCLGLPMHFEQVRKKAFSSARHGVFRSAHGQHAPFAEVSGYEGEHDFSDLEAVLVELDAGNVTRLAPFMFWTQRDPRGENSVALFDSFDGKNTGYRTVEGGAHLSVDSQHELSELFDKCNEFWSADPVGSSPVCTEAKFKVTTR